jgi:pimeloyl-ACP methyl ester carboxylesterase
MRETGASKRTVVYGWSNGGGAAIAAASLPEYIARRGTASDDLQFLGFVAMAPQDVAVMIPRPPADQASADKVVGEFIEMFSKNVFDFSHFAMTIWGTQAGYPALALTDIFSDDGAKVMDQVLGNKCMHALADTLNYNYGSQYKTLLRERPANTQAWVRAFIDGSVAPVRPVAPVIIFWGTKDVVAPPVMHQLYQQQMCKLGGNVERNQLAGEQTHFTTPGASAPLYVPWVKDRFDGKPVASGCPKGQ